MGIAWRSSKRSQERNFTYTGLSEWGPVLGVPGVVFVNLQYDDCEEELVEARERFGVEIHVPEGLDQFNDIEGVAALMSGLDLVLTVDTHGQFAFNFQHQHIGDDKITQ